jgi:N-formylglutamate amidohydrolase
MKKIYPFLISVPHGGTQVPRVLGGRLALSPEDIRYYCDPATREVFDFRQKVAAYIDTPVSRMAVDLNRPPLPIPGADPDGIVKRRTIDGREVYRPRKFPGMTVIHRLMLEHYFPYHQRIDELIDTRAVKIAFDCHSMLPTGSCGQSDAGKRRPLICLGNNGDRYGRAKGGSIATCPPEMVRALAGAFRETFAIKEGVAVNNPFSGGFVANAHYWRKGVPWVQVEVNRSLYEEGDPKDREHWAPDPVRVRRLRRKVWKALTLFWDSYKEEAKRGSALS